MAQEIICDVCRSGSGFAKVVVAGSKEIDVCMSCAEMSVSAIVGHVRRREDEIRQRESAEEAVRQAATDREHSRLEDESRRRAEEANRLTYGIFWDERDKHGWGS